MHQLVGSGRRRGHVAVASPDRLWHYYPSPGVGFGYTFGVMLADLRRPVLLVPCAAGETAFTPVNGLTWDPAASGDGSLYLNAVDLIDQALALPGATLSAVLWHQGEGDVPTMSRHDYAAKLESVATGLRARFGPAPLLIGQMSPDRMNEGHPNYPEIDAAHRDVAQRLPLSRFVPAPNWAYNAVEEKIHFNAAGQVELGRRYFAAFAQVTVTPSRLAIICR